MKLGARIALIGALILLCVELPARYAHATIGTQTSSTTVEGNGVTTQFAYPFLIPSQIPTPVVVSVLDTTVTPNVTTTLTSAQFTISGLGNASGGYVTYPLSGPALGAGLYVTITRNLPLTQTISISNQGTFYPHVVESGLDTATMQIQQLQNEINLLQAEIASGGGGGGGGITAPNLYSIPSGVVDSVQASGGSNQTRSWNSATAAPKSELLFACTSAFNGYTVSIVDEVGQTIGSAFGFSQYPVTVSTGAGSTVGFQTSVPLLNTGMTQIFQCDGNTTNWVLE